MARTRTQLVAIGSLLLGSLIGAVAASQPLAPVSCVEGETLALAYDTTALCSIESISDGDRFTFEGSGGTMIRIAAVGLSGSVTPTLRIFDPDGDELHDGPCTDKGCEFDLTETGTYFITLTELNTNNIGDYEITPTCLFGACPGAPSPLALGYNETSTSSTSRASRAPRSESPRSACRARSPRCSTFATPTAT